MNKLSFDKQLVKIADIPVYYLYEEKGFDEQQIFTFAGEEVRPQLQSEQFAVYAPQEIAYVFGTLTISLADFYNCSTSLTEQAYQVLPQFCKTIEHFPFPYSYSQIQTNDTGLTYLLTDLPVAIPFLDLVTVLVRAQVQQITGARLLEHWQKLENIHIAEDEPALISLSKRPIHLMLPTGKITLAAAFSQLPEKDLTEQVTIGDEFYAFANYSYACYVEFNTGWKTYEEFHEQFGKHIYAITATLAGETIGLIWPDFIYHQPEHHLEIGFGNSQQSARFHPFDTWDNGSLLQLEIFAEGFRPIRLETTLKKQLKTSKLLANQPINSEGSFILTLDQPFIADMIDRKQSLFLCGKEKYELVLDSPAIKVNQPNELLVDLSQLETKIAAGRYLLKFSISKYAAPTFFITIEEGKEI